jgi:hypothetical protein
VGRRGGARRRAGTAAVENGDGLNVAGIDIVFSAVESEAARLLEPQHAKTAAVLSSPGSEPRSSQGDWPI